MIRKLVKHSIQVLAISGSLVTVANAMPIPDVINDAFVQPCSSGAGNCLKITYDYTAVRDGNNPQASSNFANSYTDEEPISKSNNCFTNPEQNDTLTLVCNFDNSNQSGYAEFKITQNHPQDQLSITSRAYVNFTEARVIKPTISLSLPWN